jgi:hypothetical protein
MEPIWSLRQEVLNGFRHRHVRDHGAIGSQGCVLKIQHTTVCECLVLRIIRSLNNIRWCFLVGMEYPGQIAPDRIASCSFNIGLKLTNL